MWIGPHAGEAKRVILPVLLALMVALPFLGAEAESDLLGAVVRGDAPAVERLLKAGANANASAADENTALMFAASIGHTKIAEALLAHGAAVDSPAANGVTALMLAAAKGHSEIVQVLLAKNADVNARQERGWTALMFASEQGQTEAARALLDGGAQVETESKDKETALMLAASKGHAEIVQALLNHGADPDAQDSHGWSALVHAIWQGHAAVKRALLNAGLLNPTQGREATVADEVSPWPPSVNVLATTSREAEPVLLRVTVTGPNGKFISNLPAAAFEVYDEEVPQRLVSFSRDEAPMSLGILADDSASMRARLQNLTDLNAAVTAFLKVANPEDEFFATSFSTHPQLLTAFTRDRAGILNSFASIQLQGRTALYDGIYLAISKMREANHAKRALLVISDGDDSSSRYRERELLQLVREADVEVYCVGISERKRGRTFQRKPQEFDPPHVFSKVAEQSGGRYFQIGDINELPFVAAKIGVEMRHQYVLSYLPENRQQSESWRRVEVKIRDVEGLPPLRAHFRRGYSYSSP